MSNNKFKDAVIEYFKKYHKQHKKVPPTGKIFKEFSKAKFYHTFPKGVAEVCKLAGIPVPEARLKRTQKARLATNKKRVEEASPLQDLKQSYQIQQREEQRRKEFSRKRAEEIAILLQDPNEAISRPVVNAIENTALPVLLEKKYGIEATVPEILDMLKQYKKAVDEGWYVEYAMEWGVLSEKDRETFREICNTNTGGSIGLPDYLSTLKDEVAALISQKNRLLEEVNEIQQKKRPLEFYYSQLKTQYDNLKRDYEKREKQLTNKYNQMWREYAAAYEKAKTEMNLKIGKQLKEHERLTMRNKELRDMSKPTKRLNSKPRYGEIDFTKMWESLGFSVSEQKKKTVA
jgi:hypothetical protein